jgi:hypothetical protein
LNWLDLLFGDQAHLAVVEKVIPCPIEQHHKAVLQFTLAALQSAETGREVRPEDVK